MQLAIGDVLEGKVTGITKFGAFVELPEGKTGMVHISEVSTAYVEDISQYLEENQVVKVKIINITEEGKISLSIKKAMPREARPPQAQGGRPAGNNNPGGIIIGETSPVTIIIVVRGPVREIAAPVNAMNLGNPLIHSK